MRNSSFNLIKLNCRNTKHSRGKDRQNEIVDPHVAHSL